jgi:1-acyl-sn-glycerol-3-phosphate acyltransferase
MSKIKKILDFLDFVVRLSAIIIVTIFDSIRIIIFMLFSKDKMIFCKYSRKWSVKLLKIAGVRVIISGADYLDNSKNYIIITNHSSLFDIPILLASLNFNVVIMYKKELENIPVFGWALRRSPFIAVERADAHSAMDSIDHTVRLIQGDVSVIIFPEGTRSADGKLGTFKRGAFLVAIKSHKPIIPITIVGSSKLLQSKKFRFQSGEVRLVIHEPIIEVNTSNRLEEKAFIESVREMIGKELEKD